MKNNLTFAGLLADENDENPIVTLHEFLVEKMHLDIPKSQIISAQRIGIPAKIDQPRLIAAQLEPSLKSLIMSNLSVLKGVTNSNKKSYSISRQVPDQWSEENRRLKEAIAKAKKKNEAKQETEEKDIIEVKKGKLYINKEVQITQSLAVPKTENLFVDKQEQDKIDRIKFHVSSPLEEKGSKFTAFATKLQSLTEAKRAYIKLKQIFPSASHIMMAYSFKNNHDGYQDDREFGASVQILRTLKEQQNISNIAVYMVREHDGTHIGPRRHQLIEKVVLEAIAKYKN